MKTLTGVLAGLAIVLALAACGTQAETPNPAVMTGTVVEITNTSLLVEPVKDSPEWNSSNRFDIPLEKLEASPEPVVGDTVEIAYNGDILETYPAGLGEIYYIQVTRSTVAGGDPCPSVCIDGVTYYDTGRAVPVEPDESAIEYVELPVGDGDAKITAFARLEEGKLLVCLIGGEWYEFAVK